MPTAEAHVPTDRPSRYLVQLCKHFSNKGSHLKHRPRNHHGDDGTAARHEPLDIDPAQIFVEWTDTHGTVTLPRSTCDLRAGQGELVLRLEAATEADLQKLRDLLTVHLGRFGRRDQLQVEWDRPGATPASPADPAPARRSRLAWAGLAALVIAVVAVHLGLADALLSASDWTSWAVGAVLAMITVKLAVALVVGRRMHRRSGRRA
jgi:hypothetical protein